jgi:dGTPase
MAMLIREDYEKIEDERLAPFASKSSLSRGRKHPESEDTIRTAFQRDRDRIIHSAAFRRLEYKTQVFVNHEGDHYRTRLTHTIEVSQIARSIARALRLNEDLTEAIVLAHDLGHTPFGHAGERTMNNLMENYGGFEHNLQSLRVVDHLEKRYLEFDGLNLTYEVREGICKHSSAYDITSPHDEFFPGKEPSLEGQIVDLADEIAYNNHDIDDGLRSGLITQEQLEDVTLWNEAKNLLKKRFSSLDSDALKHRGISTIISFLARDLTFHSSENIVKAGISTADDVRDFGRRMISFSDEMHEKNEELKKFLYNNMYCHYRVIRMEEKAKRIIVDLYDAYKTRPEQLPPGYFSKKDTEGLERVICDYIAGMTDRFALNEHKKLFDPHEKV